MRRRRRRAEAAAGSEGAASTEQGSAAAASAAPASVPAASVPEEPPAPLARFLRAISAIGPPVTIAGALLLYFGWARTAAQARALGLEVSLFGYTPQDYMLRSITSLFSPLIAIIVAGILWNGLDHWLRRLVDTGRARMAVRRVALIVAVLGALAAVILFLAEWLDQSIVLFRPYLIALGVLFAAWGLRLHRYAREGRRRLTTEQRAVETTLVLSLVTLLLFWGTSDFAGALGRGLVAQYERSVADLPRTVLYSSSPLGIGAPGVSEEAVGSVDAPLYRYTGLRLLVLSGGRFFFLHDGWTRADGLVTVLPDDKSLRFEFGN